MTRTFKEIWLEVDVENVSTQTLDRVIERKDVNTFAVLDIETLMHVDEIGQFDPEIIASNLVHLNPTFLDVIGTQADENCVSSLFPTNIMDYRQRLSWKRRKRHEDAPNDDSISTEKSKDLHCCRIESCDCMMN